MGIVNNETADNGAANDRTMYNGRRRKRRCGRWGRGQCRSPTMGTANNWSADNGAADDRATDDGYHRHLSGDNDVADDGARR